MTVIKKHLSYPAAFVAASNASARDISRADYVCDGTADEVQINAALQTYKNIVLSRGQFDIADEIVIDADNMTITGQGNSTVLRQGNGSDLLAVISITGAGTVQYQVRKLHIEGNTANNTFGNGINVNTPWVNASVTVEDSNDPNGVFEDIYINDTSNNGFAVTASSDSRVMHLKRVRVRNAEGNGFYMPAPSCTDSILDDCIAENIQLNGFYVGCLNTHFINCKSFWCGLAGGHDHGFNITGYNNYFENCEAQDCYDSGFYSDGSTGDATYHTQYNTLVNCIGDSNGQSGSASYSCGIQLKDCVGWQIIGGLWMTRPYPGFTQRKGISLEGTTTLTRIIGAMGTGNSVALYSDTSSGSNYPLHVPGYTSKFSDDVQLADTKKLYLGNGTPYISGDGDVILINGANNSIHIDNFTEVFLNDDLPTLQLYNASSRTLRIVNDGGGAANVSVQNNLSVADEAYGVGWNGSVNVPTKNAVYDKIETIIAGTPPVLRTILLMGA
jgi:hypothetical protein